MKISLFYFDFQSILGAKWTNIGYLAFEKTSKNRDTVIKNFRGGPSNNLRGLPGIGIRGGGKT